jgi:hypothetical protein
MTATWTVDDNGNLIYGGEDFNDKGIPARWQDWLSRRDLSTAGLDALVADVRAARLADNLAAIVRRLTDGWCFGELFDDPVDGDNFWFKGVMPDGYEYEFEDEMSPGEVAALRHARREDG